MRAVVVAQRGGPESMQVERIAIPTPGDHQMLVRVRAAALNHADLMQRAGEWTAPAGECQRLGVEVAGDVVVGDAAGQVVCGSAVCGLVGGGGYGEYCVMDVGMAIPVPAGLSYAQAAALPEGCLTGDTCLFALERNPISLAHIQLR